MVSMDKPMLMKMKSLTSWVLSMKTMKNNKSKKTVNSTVLTQILHTTKSSIMKVKLPSSLLRMKMKFSSNPNIRRITASIIMMLLLLITWIILAFLKDLNNRWITTLLRLNLIRNNSILNSKCNTVL